MQVLPVKFNTNYNPKVTKNAALNPTVSFQADPRLIKAINKNSLKEDSTKKLYEKIQKYIEIIGKEGKVENVPVDKENGFFSIYKKENNFELHVKDKQYNVLMNASFDKDGQMIEGDLHSNLFFHRLHKNIRVITDGFKVYHPCGYDDTVWRNGGKRIELNGLYNDVANLFLELARLHTSILK